jgi:hypothetical protein
VTVFFNHLNQAMENIEPETVQKEKPENVLFGF